VTLLSRSLYNTQFTFCELKAFTYTLVWLYKCYAERNIEKNDSRIKYITFTFYLEMILYI